MECKHINNSCSHFNKFLLLCLLFLLQGCSFNPFTTNNNLTGNLAAPVVGGAAGAGVMALLGAPKAVIALAGIGGAGLGYYVTTLRYASSGIIQADGQVFALGDYLTISVPSDKIFDVNTAEFLPCADPILLSIVAVLCRYPNNNILISGNTSGFASNRYERKLSENRARQIASYLWSHGIMSVNEDSFHTRKLTYVGYGNYFPVANNLYCCSIRQNSRIQITAYPTNSQLFLDVHCKTFGNIGVLEE